MSMQKIVRIWGGLGNQMFIYAFAKALEKATGCPVLFDAISHYGSGAPELAGRGFCLDIFDVDIQFATADQIVDCIGYDNKYLRYILRKLHLKKWIMEDYYCKFHEEFLENKESAYYCGYWQNEKYFKPIENTLRTQFTFPDFKDDYNKRTYERLANSSNSCFIHIRRSDYQSSDYLSINYYRNAVKYIQERVENAHFYVFGAECPDYIKNEFDIGCNFEFLGENNTLPENHYEDMRLMTACANGIIANSSYSWWGAYLGENRNNRIIVAPTSWLQGKNEIICDRWVKISG